MDISLLDFLSSVLRIATPLLFGAMGSILSERAGVFAVGLEGMMLAGAFGAALFTFLTGYAVAGIAGSMAAGAMVAVVVAGVTVRLGADQMVTGLAVNVLVAGATSFLVRTVVERAHVPSMQAALLSPWPLPLLSDIPFVGPLLFSQPPLTYLALLLIAPLHFFLTRTQSGLMLRAVGENPAAAYSVGTDPNAVRMAAVIAGGAVAGLGGAVLVLQQVGTFTDGMTSGRGFLALAAIIVGRWTPWGAFAACLVFGAAEALHLRLQMSGLPVSSYVMQMLPYLIALAVLAGLGRSVRLPAGIGKYIE
ncbi:MAG TPA: ABC transporter permease [Bordetella sp.]|nr:ABC transporter permease [Bordetella sp.]